MQALNLARFRSGSPGGAETPVIFLKVIPNPFGMFTLPGEHGALLH